MAHIHPTLPNPRVVTARGLATEVEVLKALEHGLPDAYTLFHSVDWMRPTESGTARGEIDVVVLNQGGDVALIEIKAGDVEFTREGIFKRYASDHHSRNVVNQVSLQYGSIKARLKELHLQVKVHQLLVLPHMRVENETAQWPRDRIVDASEYQDLPFRIQQLLGPGEWNEAVHDQLYRFFANHFRIHLDVSSILRQSEQSTSVLSAGLATWVPRVHSAEGTYRINATAGSGKTQLALQLLNEADRSNLRAAYFCFNSPLAALIAKRVRPRVRAETFHHHARQICERLGQRVDFSQPGVFERISDVAAQHLASEASQPDLDLLVIDEMQDMTPAWVQALLRRVKPSGGRAYLFEDTDQVLYADRDPFDVEGQVTISSNDNARSPQQIVKLINELRLTKDPINGLNPYSGSIATPRVYRESNELHELTQAAVQDCLDLGFKLNEIAVLTGRGREASQLLKLERIGPWRLRKASGQRDIDGQELMSEGDLLCETVHRFKGQAAGAVVLSELDLTPEPEVIAGDTDAEYQRRMLRWQRLYVGLTRAQAHLALVISVAAEKALIQRLGG